ncbi:MAG: ABC transporter ATP-binding protein [Actinobacteria bacterium]|nr:ABC transporter ATP-binding protein [Actinomycetota bacterium]
MRTVLELEGVSKVYGHGEAAVAALDGIDLELARGELLVIMGPSGSGKTTLLQVAGALSSPTSGTVRVDGDRIDRMSRREVARLRAERIGFVFQAFNLLSNLSAESNVRLPTMLLPRRRRPDDRRPRELLEELGVGNRARHRPGQLSGGQQQRVALARALVNDPALILADEPTGNLDSRSGEQVLELLERMARARGKSVLIVTHDERIAGQADRVLWLQDGRLGRPGGPGGAVPEAPERPAPARIRSAG